MFPFTLSGPPFLVFYVVLTLAVLIGYWFYRRAREGESFIPRMSELTSEPYRIAFLRGGDEELVRLGVINLVDRGLLVASDGGATLRTKDGASAEMLRRPLDRALLACFKVASQPGAAMLSSQVRGACAQYRSDLVTEGLLLDDGRRWQVLAGLVVVLGVLGGVAVARVLQALSRGQGNIWFLVVAGGFACWVAYRIGQGNITASGDRALSSLKTLMKRLKDRAASLPAGGASNEALLLAAVFGIHALPASAFPFVEALYPRPKTTSDGGDWGSGSSSCGSSGGSSCGGGGGGCGGCGGG